MNALHITLRRSQSRTQSGSILVVTLLVLGALTVLGLATIALSGMDGEIAINQRAGDQALYVAEAGVYYGVNQVSGNLAYAQGAGTTFPAHQLTDGTTSQSFPGGQAANVNVTVGPAPDENLSSVKCGLVGFSDKFGSYRFSVLSTGVGPAGATRQVEAVVQLPPQEGLCTPGANTGSCTYAGGC